MKNTSYLGAVATYIREAIKTPDTTYHNKFGTCYDWEIQSPYNEFDRKIMGLSIDEICDLADAEFAQGANCQAFVLPDGVVKWYTGMGCHDDANSVSDQQVYDRAVRMGYDVNFARTESFGNVTVQERIVPYDSVMETLRRDHRLDVESQVRHIGDIMQIGDLHEGNWGFRPGDTAFSTPVIFDYSWIRPGEDSSSVRYTVRIISNSQNSDSGYTPLTF